ncbi:MAG: MBOAT family protein, partial [Paramuribaculum sp.]|nr:MBOAT family protein [Paramuribaculum sp.]
GLFWVLFVCFMPLYALMRRRKWQMLVFVIAFSLYFYYKCSGWFFLLLVSTSVIDWFISRAMVQIESSAGRKWLVALSVVISLSVLGFFKYANFFLWNWNSMVEGNFQPLTLILPVGISFYTFQSISYIVDVYRKRIAPADTWGEYLFFLSFFPALVAGPIVRAENFLPQLKENRRASHSEIFGGLWLIITGVVKKAVIADYIAQYNDLIFNSPGAYSGFESLMGVIGYTMQIYCDFSGYSDMAIGLALIMGFQLSINFNFPYKSKSLTEFWRRWHISLSTWLRDYVYIPIGGNRKGTFRTYLNNFLTMLIGGLWHGAAWKFIFWGGMHGIGLIVNKLCRPITARFDGKTWFDLAAGCLTLIYVSLLWVFFRAESFTDAVVIIRTIFTDFAPQCIIPFIQFRTLWVILMTFIIAVHFLPQGCHDRAATLFIRAPWIVRLLIFLIVIQLVVEFSSADVTPFIYFQY